MFSLRFSLGFGLAYVFFDQLFKTWQSMASAMASVGGPVSKFPFGFVFCSGTYFPWQHLLIVVLSALALSTNKKALVCIWSLLYRYPKLFVLSFLFVCLLLCWIENIATIHIKFNGRQGLVSLVLSPNYFVVLVSSINLLIIASNCLDWKKQDLDGI